MFEFEVLDKSFILKLLITVLALLLLIRPSTTRNTLADDSGFIYFMFGIGVFLVTYALKEVDMSLGFAFGLFAIFSMLRYRTEVITIRQMTYLFLVIVISLLCAVSPLNKFELVLVISVIIVAAQVFEMRVAKRRLIRRKNVRYEKIENIKPEKHEVLLNDLRARTGLDILSVDIVSVDFMQDSAMLTIFYKVAPTSTPASQYTSDINYGVEELQ